MLKNNKSIENFDCVNNTQLVAELTPEEGSAISGGLTLNNFTTKANLFVRTINKFSIIEEHLIPTGTEGKDIILPEGTAYVLYDKKIGDELELELKEVDINGLYSFNESDGIISLTAGKSLCLGC